MILGAKIKSFFGKRTEPTPSAPPPEMPAAENSPVCLADDYFLAVQCERAECRRCLAGELYKFCPQCGAAVTVCYDYYALFNIRALGTAAVDEQQLKKQFRELSLLYHPDAQPQAAAHRHQHDNFAFLKEGFDVLSVPASERSYRQQYVTVLTTLYPERTAAAAILPPPPPPVAEQSPAGLIRLMRMGLTVSDLCVTGVIVFLVMRTYLWGAAMALVGAWTYFKKTRQLTAWLSTKWQHKV